MFSQVERKWSMGEYLSNGGCVKCGFGVPPKSFAQSTEIGGDWPLKWMETGHCDGPKVVVRLQGVVTYAAVNNSAISEPDGWCTQFAPRILVALRGWVWLRSHGRFVSQ